MATLDDNPSLYLGQPWSVWADKIEGMGNIGAVNKDGSRSTKQDEKSMKLRKKDMPLYGHCPARDEFFLVVCEKCGQIIKPQALQNHMEHRHGAPKATVCRAKTPTVSSVATSHPVDSLLHMPDLGLSQSSIVHPHTVKHDIHGKSPPDKIRCKTSSQGGNVSIDIPVIEVHNAVIPDNKICVNQPGNNTLLTSPTKQPVVKVHRMPSISGELVRAKTLPTCNTLPHQSKSPQHTKTHSSPHSKSSKSSKSTVGSIGSLNHENVWTADSRSVERTVESYGNSHGTSRLGEHVELHLADRSEVRSGEPVIRLANTDRKPNVPVMPPPPISPAETPPPPLSPILSSPNTPIFPSPSQIRPTPSPGSVQPPVMVTVSVTTPIISAVTTNGPPKQIATSSHSKKSKSSNNPNKVLPLKDREFDANIHCGVTVEETGLPCTRSLTCKSHALSLRRAVSGRRKSFDELLREHREAKEAQLKAKAEASGKPYIPPGHGHGSKSPAHSSKVAVHHSSQSSVPHQLHKMSTLPIAPQSPDVMPSLTKLPKPALPPRPGPIPVVPKEEPVPETCSRLSSDGEDDGEDDTGHSGYPYLPYHPRPAAVNNFGSRLAGAGYYVFNRKQDLLRAAFMVAVDRHLHPPPHKKLCVESKLPQAPPSNTKDPYEFEFLDPAPGGATGRLAANKSKLKPAPLSPLGRSLKSKDGQGMVSRNPGTSPVYHGTTINMVPPSQVSNTVTGSPIMPGKRKRSGSGGASPGAMNLSQGLPAGMSVNNANGSAGISISLPPGQLSGQLTLSALNNAISLASKQGGTPTLSKNHHVSTLPTSATAHCLKDVNIHVVTDGGVVNGQLVGSQLTDIPLQMGQFVQQPDTSSHSKVSSRSKHKSGNKHTATSQGGVELQAALSTGPHNTLMMDSVGTMITPLTVVSSSMSPPDLTNPAAVFTSVSSSTGVSQTANGLLQKNMPLNHVGGAITVSPANSVLDNNQASLYTKTQGRHKKSSHSTITLQSSTSGQLGCGGSITLAPGGGRVTAPTMFYTGQPVALSGGGTGTGYSHIQIAPRGNGGGGKGGTKLSVQPVLSIPVIGSSQAGMPLTAGGQAQRTLLLQGDDRRSAHIDLTQKIQSNSPSNLIS